MMPVLHGKIRRTTVAGSYHVEGRGSKEKQEVTIAAR